MTDLNPCEKEIKIMSENVLSPGGESNPFVPGISSPPLHVVATGSAPLLPGTTPPPPLAVVPPPPTWTPPPFVPAEHREWKAEHKIDFEITRAFLNAIVSTVEYRRADKYDEAW